MKEWFAAAARHFSDAHPLSHTERLVSVIGSLIGILVVIQVSGQLLHGQGAALMVASMGASAVLVFAVPHGSLSQPWNLLGGHLSAACIGVGCARLVPDAALAASLAVALSIGAMHYLRCLHPPGGATALTAVIGGPGVDALGWGFVVQPVLVNVITLLGVAVLLGLLFAHRRYPLLRVEDPAGVTVVPATEQQEKAIAHSDLVYALSQIDSFIDVEEEDLLRIYALALGHSHEPVTVDAVAGQAETRACSPSD